LWSGLGQSRMQTDDYYLSPIVSFVEIV